MHTTPGPRLLSANPPGQQQPIDPRLVTRRVGPRVCGRDLLLLLLLPGAVVLLLLGVSVLLLLRGCDVHG